MIVGVPKESYPGERRVALVPGVLASLAKAGLEVMVEAINQSGIAEQRELTVTETLSSLGTCVPTNLEVEVGRVLRISSVTDHVSLFAAIRSVG